MLWIIYRKNELIRDGSLEPRSGIPEELKYPDWQTDRNNKGETSLMLWVKCITNELDRNKFLPRCSVRDEFLEQQSDIPEELK
jgi:hypothetical protein